MSEKTTVATLGAVEFDPFAGPAILTTAPSTEPQREIWTAVRMGDEASLAFNESVSVVLQGAFDLAAARASLADLVARHESLRSTFTADGLTLCVSADAPPDVPLVDLSRATAAERDAERARALVAAVTTPFDLERGPLFRAVVLRLSPEEHQVVLTGHHIVVDGWSWAVLIADWAKLYAARRDGQPAATLPPAERFSEHAREEAVRQRGPELLADESYWLKQFAGEIPVLDLPPDRARPNLKTFASRREDIRLGAELVQQLKRTGAKEGSSFFTILLAGFKVLVHRLTGQEDVVVGMPAAGQAALGKNGLVGHCVNNLPLRSRVLPDTPFRDLLKSVRGTVLDAYEHQAHTFGSLLRKLPLPRDPSRQPLAPVAFNLDQTLPPEALRPFGAGARFSSNPRHYEMFDLFVNAVEDDGGVVLECQYNTDLYDGASVRRWMKSYEVLLAAVAQDAGRAVGDLPVLDEAEQQVILFDWNRTKPSPRPEATLHQVFAEQARQRAEAVAVIHGDTALSYGELDRRSSQLAHALRRLGVSPGVLVGVCLERSLDTVVTLLGILKAGGGYLPLEHSYPKERLSFMLEDAGVGLVVTQSSLEGILPAFAGRTFCLDRERGALAAENGANAPDSGATAESLCYVIYTSGSTGKPKGVLVPHRGPIRLLCGVEYLDLNADTVLLHSGNLAFDVSTAEIWGGLVNGGRCVLHTENVLTGGGLAEAIARHGVNTWITTTAIFNSIVDEDPGLFRGLRQIVVGGEAMSVAHARRFQEAQPQIELINAYGPTEATVISTTCSVPVPLPREARSVPIGRPIADTTHYVLDERQKPVPLGVVGELYIGGAGLALGYLNRKELTAERFVLNPFVTGQRLYRSGDLVRYLPGGALDFVGRADGQVKLRGLRIELGEIEAALLAHPAVAQAAVIVREDRPGVQALVAYVVPAADATATDAEILQRLGETLPKSMVPQHLLRLEKMPLNSSGKVDRRALPAPAGGKVEAEAYVAPATATEALLAGLWEKALGLRRIGTQDNFFALGGHSLLAAQVLSRLNREHQIVLPFRSIFEAPTIAGLAALVDGRTQEERAKPVTRIPRRAADAGPGPVSLMQERVLLLEELDPERCVVHNAPSAFRLEGALDASALEGALRDLVARQEALRTVFRRENGVYRQHVLPTVAFDLVVHDWRSRPEAERDVAVRAFLKEERGRAFDLEQGPLFRAFLLRLRDDEHILFTVRHNTVWDGWSFDIFRHELATFYETRIGGTPAALPELSASYSDFSAWHRGFLEGPEIQGQLEFWRKRLADHPEPLNLPTDRPRSATRSYSGADEWIKIPRSEADAVAELGRELGATSFMVLLAAFEVLLHRYTGQEDILVASPVRNRPRPEIEDIMGLFTNTLMLRTEVDPKETFTELLGRVRTMVLDAFSHQELPFELLAREAPPVRVTFSLQEARHRETSLGPVRLSLPHILPAAAAVDLNFWLVEMKDGLTGAINYSTDIFDQGTMARFLGHYRELLADVLRNPRRPVAALSLGLAAPAVPAPTSPAPAAAAAAPLDKLVQLRAEQLPQENAIVGPEGALTSRALVDRVNALASWLRQEGIGPSSRVGIVLERPLEETQALLALLRAGVIAVPLSAQKPDSRLAEALRAAGVTHLIADPDADPVETAPGVRTLSLPPGAEERATPFESDGTATVGWIDLVPRPSGTPLVVEVEKGAAAAALASVAQELRLTSKDVVVVTPEAGPLALLLPLAGRSLLALVDREQAADADDLARAIKDSGATVVVTSPANLRALVAADWPGSPSLRLVSTEPMAPDLASELRQRASGVFSLYAAFDSGQWNALARLDQPSAYAVLGRPLPGHDLVVLDSRGVACPIDIPGELALAGEGLSPQPTGDRARLRADGSLEWWGRTDGRVRLRGLSADLGEIRSRLEEHPALAEAEVLVRPDRRGQERLVAYVVRRPAADYTDSELRRDLRRSLPEPMIPSHFVELKALARDASGVVDRRGLPVPASLGAAGVREEPRTDEERLLVELWQEALGVTGVSVRDNFFDMGGHSLLSLQVVARIEERTGKKIKPRLLLLSSLEQVAGELARA